MTVSAVARVFASSAVMRGGAQSLATRTRSWSSVRLPDVGMFALVGLGSAVRSRRLARVRASGVIASLRDEVVASAVIVCPSSQQPCSYSARVKCGGGTTRRCRRRFPERNSSCGRSVAIQVVATKSLIFWPRACRSEGCFFDHWRSDMAFPLITVGATRRAVRKHQAS